MINPAPFIKRSSPRSFNRRNKGGDYRYLYVLNRKDQTVTVIDTSTNTVSATITLTASKTFSSLAYRPADRSVWVFGNNYIDRIDADPTSGSFNTIAASYTTTSGAGASVTYIEPYDIFLYSSGVINAKNRVFTGLNFTSNYMNVYLRKQNLVFLANINYGFSGTMIVTGRAKVIPGIQPFLQTQSVDPIKVGDYIYSGVGGTFSKGRWSTLKQITNITAAQASNAAGAYDPVNNRIWFGSITNGSTNVQVVKLSDFTLESTEVRSGSIDTNESATRELLYCPYNGYVYAKASNTSLPATGLGRVHYYNTANAASSRYVNYVSTGQDGSGALYARGTMCFNGLRQMEY